MSLRAKLYILLCFFCVLIALATPVGNDPTGKVTQLYISIQANQSYQVAITSADSVSIFKDPKLVSGLNKNIQQGVTEAAFDSQDFSYSVITNSFTKVLFRKKRVRPNLSINNSKFEFNKTLQDTTGNLINIISRALKRSAANENYILVNSTNKLSSYISSNRTDIFVFSTAQFSAKELNQIKVNNANRWRILRKHAKYVKSKFRLFAKNFRNSNPSNNQNSDIDRQFNSPTPTVTSISTVSPSDGSDVSEEVSGNEEDDDENWYLQNASSQIFEKVILRASFPNPDNEDSDELNKKIDEIISRSTILSEYKKLQIPSELSVGLVESLKENQYFKIDNCFDVNDQIKSSRKQYWSDESLNSLQEDRSLKQQIVLQMLSDFSISDDVNQNAIDVRNISFIEKNLASIIKDADQSLGCKFLEETFWDEYVSEESNVANQGNYSLAASQNPSTKKRLYPFVGVSRLNKATRYDSELQAIVDRVKLLLDKNPNAPYANKIAHYLNLVVDPDFLTKGGLASDDINYYLGGFWGLLLQQNWADPFDHASTAADVTYLGLTASSKLQKYASASQVKKISDLADKLQPLATKLGAAPLSKVASVAQKASWILTVVQLSQPLFKGHFEGDKATFFESQRKLSGMSNVSRLILLFMVGEGYFSTYHLPSAVPQNLRGALDYAMNNPICANAADGVEPESRALLPYCWHPTDKKVLQQVFFPYLKNIEDNSPIAKKGWKYQTFEKKSIVPFILKWLVIRSTVWTSKNDARNKGMGDAMLESFITLAETFAQQLVVDKATQSVISKVSKPIANLARQKLKIDTPELREIGDVGKVIRSDQKLVSLGTANKSKQVKNAGSTTGTTKVVRRVGVSPCVTLRASTFFPQIVSNAYAAGSSSARPCSVNLPEGGFVITGGRDLINEKDVALSQAEVIFDDIVSRYRVTDPARADVAAQAKVRLKSILDAIVKNPLKLEQNISNYIERFGLEIKTNGIKTHTTQPGQDLFYDYSSGIVIKTRQTGVSSTNNGGLGQFKFDAKGLIRKPIKQVAMTDDILKRPWRDREPIPFANVKDPNGNDILLNNNNIDSLDLRWHSTTPTDRKVKEVLRIELEYSTQPPGFPNGLKFKFECLPETSKNTFSALSSRKNGYLVKMFDSATEKIVERYGFSTVELRKLSMSATELLRSSTSDRLSFDQDYFPIERFPMLHNLERWEVRNIARNAERIIRESHIPMEIK